MVLGLWAANVAKHLRDMIDAVQEFWCRCLPCQQSPVTETVNNAWQEYSGVRKVAV